MKKKLVIVMAICFCFAGFAKTVGVTDATASISEAKVTGYWGNIYGKKGAKDSPRSQKRSEATPDVLFEAETPKTINETLTALTKAIVDQLNATKLCQVKAGAREEDKGLDYLLKMNVDEFSANRELDEERGIYKIKISIMLVDCTDGHAVLPQSYEVKSSPWTVYETSKSMFAASSPKPYTLPEYIAKTEIAIDIINTIEVPTVIEAKKNGSITFRSLGFETEDMLYVLDKSNVLVAEAVVYDVNQKTGIASAMVDPEGVHAGAKFEEGMIIRSIKKGIVSSDKNGGKAKKRANDFIKESEKASKNGQELPVLSYQDELGKRPVLGIAAAKILIKAPEITGYWGDIYYNAAKALGGGISVNTAYANKQLPEAPNLYKPAENPPSIRDVMIRFQESLFEGFADTGRFAVTEHLDGNTNGLDYLVNCELVSLTANRVGIPTTNEKFFTTLPGSCSYTMAINLKVTDVKTGKVVFEQRIDQNGERKISKISSTILTPRTMPDELGKQAALSVTKEILPSKVLGVENKVIRIPATGLGEKQIVDILDESGKLVAEAVVFEIDRRIANVMADPLGAYANAAISEGMNVTNTEKENKTAVKNVENEIKARNKAAKKNAKAKK